METFSHVKGNLYTTPVTHAVNGFHVEQCKRESLPCVVKFANTGPKAYRELKAHALLGCYLFNIVGYHMHIGQDFKRFL